MRYFKERPETVRAAPVCEDKNLIVKTNCELSVDLQDLSAGWRVNISTVIIVSPPVPPVCPGLPTTGSGGGRHKG